MNTDTTIALLLTALIVQTVALHTAEASAIEATEPTHPPTTTTTIITPRLYAFEHADVSNPGSTLFLQRHDALHGNLDGALQDKWFDLDLSLKVNNGERDLFTLQRRGFGEHNHRLNAEFNNDALSIYTDYTHYRSLSAGLDYLFRPDAPDLLGGGIATSGPGFTREFNNDAEPGHYRIDRSSADFGFKIKQPVLANSATVAFDFSSYQRDGKSFTAYQLDGGDIRGRDRWRGMNLSVDEQMDRVGVTLSASPYRKFEIVYQAAVEQFDNQAKEILMQRDIVDPGGLTQPSSTSPLASLFYVPDTELLSHGLRVSRNFSNRTLLAAGLGATRLRQQSYSSYEVASAHDNAEINTRNAYLNVSSLFAGSLSLEAYVKSSHRDNDSTFDDGLLSLAEPVTVIAPRIDRIDTLDYGLAVNWRADSMHSRFSLGWRGLDKDRDLTFGSIGRSLLVDQTLYREQTKSNEIYFKWRARPGKGWNLRVTPSYTQADNTGLVTEPEQALALKTKVSYASVDGWMFNVFYDYERQQNGNNAYSAADGSSSYKQEVERSTHTSGIGWNLKPHRNIDTHINILWTEDDFSSYLFRSTFPRWNPFVDFELLEEPNYRVSSQVGSLGMDWQLSDRTLFNASYSYTRSDGDVASGLLQDSLQRATGSIDAVIDNSLHSIALGLDYETGKNSRLQFDYFYDDYRDHAYDALSGDLHMVVVGFSIEF